MSRFRKLTHAIWHCQYHIVWVPKYRYRILTGALGYEVEQCIRLFSSQKSCELLELSVQIDHVHVVCMIPPKLSISDYVGIVKGRTAIRVLKKYPDLKKKPYWGNHFGPRVIVLTRSGWILRRSVSTSSTKRPKNGNKSR